MTMTTKELLALVEKATPGPWKVTGSWLNVQAPPNECSPFPVTVCLMPAGSTPGENEANFNLIVAAVNALPALCAEVDDLMKSAAMLAVERAEFRIRAENTPRLILLAIAEQFDEMAQAARQDGELERRDVWRDAASQARARINHADWIDAATDAAKEPK